MVGNLRGTCGDQTRMLGSDEVAAPPAHAEVNGEAAPEAAAAATGEDGEAQHEEEPEVEPEPEVSSWWC
jgi:hypothetical protein